MRPKCKCCRREIYNRELHFAFSTRCRLYYTQLPVADRFRGIFQTWIMPYHAA